MSNYTKTVDFAAKDSLASGDVNKRIKGTELNTEFANIQTAVNSKLDSSDFTASNIASGVLATANGGTGSSSATFCNLTTNVTGTLPPGNGGTGVSTLGGTNALLYTSVANSLQALSNTASAILSTNASGTIAWTPGTTANRLLKTNGTSVSFAQADLTTDVTGTLPLANGGTGAIDAANARISLDVPANDGTGATGTWGIDISGNAATATAATTYGGTINMGTQATGVLAISNGGTGASNAATAASNIGVNGAGQNWQSFSSPARQINTDYQNTTGRPISVSVALTTVSAGANNPTFYVATGTPATTGVIVSYFTNGTTGTINATVGPIIVPNNAYYRIAAAAGTSVAYWAELR